MPRIYVLSGPDLGRTFDVEDGATFGRTAECQVILRDASVSRAHARLERGDSGWRVVDAGSRNGLYLRDERVPAALLEDGDEFRLGEVILRFRADVASARSESHAPSAPPSAPPSTPSAPITPSTPEPAAPAIQFHARGVSRSQPADEPMEIELEGEWSQPTAPPPMRPRTDRETAGIAEDSVRSGSGSATAAPRSIASDERARKMAAAGLTPARSGDPGARGVLQFHKVAQQEGVLRQELDQQPLWLRLTAVVVVLAIVVALSWFGYQAATATKARLAPAESIEDEAR